MKCEVAEGKQKGRHSRCSEARCRKLVARVSHIDPWIAWIWAVSFGTPAASSCRVSAEKTLAPFGKQSVLSCFLRRAGTWPLGLLLGGARDRH